MEIGRIAQLTNPVAAYDIHQEQVQLIAAQQKSINFVLDAVFGKHVKVRKQTDDDLMTEAIYLASRLERVCEKLVIAYPFSKHDNYETQQIASEINEARLKADDAFTDLAAAKNRIKQISGS